MRRQAVMRLFESKFQSDTRITVGSATCENAAGAQPVYERFAALLKEKPRASLALGAWAAPGAATSSRWSPSSAGARSPSST